jgi:hypothetical protein
VMPELVFSRPHFVDEVAMSRSGYTDDYDETPEQRWTRMRAWVASQVQAVSP